ncbi:MAG: DUF202 domain-containing protein [Pseudomonadota bacterium]
MIANYTELAANERTFLAWVRTSITMVGFGLVATRITHVDAPLWSEALLMASGGLVTIVAYLRMLSIRRRILSRTKEKDEAVGADVFLIALIIALLILLGMFAVHVA